MSIIRKEQLTNPLSASYALTASYAENASSTTFNTSSLVTTSSFNAFTASINTFTSSYNTGSFSGSFTGSLTGTASWAEYVVNGGNIDTSSFAITGSNIFVGDQIINGENLGFIVDAGNLKRVGFMKYGGLEGSIARVADQNFRILRTTGSNINDGTNAITDFYIAGDGKVGIGTTTPAYTLDISGSSNLTGNQTITGSINFGDGSLIQSISASSGDGGGYATLTLKPDTSLASDQYIVLDPTTPNHIHIRAGGVIDSSSAYLYLGGEKANVVVQNLDYSFNEKHWVQINSQTGSTQNTWTFDDNGVLSAPGRINAPSFSGSFTGSFTGSLLGTSSWAESASQAISSSYASTASNILGGKATHVPFFITDTRLATSSIYQSGSTSVIINADVNTAANPEALFVEQTHPTSFNVISGKGNLNNYLQLNIQNRNAGTSVSSDVVATANNGDENGNYIDMGINGSNFSGPVGNANDAYLYTTGSHLHIGNATPNMPVQFFAGGLDTNTNRKFELNTNNQHNMTGSLDISGSLNVRNNLTSSGLLTNGNNNILGNTTMSGSSTIQGTTTMTGSLNITGSTTQIGNNSLEGNTTLSGSIVISGSVTTPTTPTIKMYGDMETNGVIKFMPVNKNIDTSISASYIYVSGSTQDLYFSQNGSGYNNVTRLRWLEGNLYTGLLHGGLITTQSSTVYQISSGSGIIVNLNASIPNDPYPTVQYLTWPNLSASIAPLSASFDQQFVAINSTTNITAQGTPYNNGQFNTLIPIGIIVHQNRSSINAVQTFPSTAYGWKQRSSDFIRAFGPLKISGYALQPSSSLGLLLGGGTAFVDGRNYTIDPNNPSYIQEATGITTSKIYYYYQSGSDFKYLTNAGAGYANVTSSLYSLNGTLTPLSNNNKWSIQRVYYFPNSATKAFYIYYGNAEYDNYTAALTGISTEQFNEAPNTAANALFIGYMLLQKTANFTTPSGSTGTWEFRPAGLFRGSGGGGNAGSGGGATTLAGLTDVAISSPTNGQPLVYNSTTTKWSNSSSLTASLHGTASWAEYVVNSGGNAFPYTGSAIVTGSLVITGSTTSTLGFTGSLFGTSSWAFNASQSISSSFATSASYATTAQNVLGSVTSADTASYATNFTIANILTLNATLTDFYSVSPSTGPGINNLFTKNTGSFTSAFGKYTIYSGSNSRAGEFVTSWNGTTVSYYDNATVDIGDTSTITFASAIVSGQIQINTGNTTPSGWQVKMLATFM